MDQAKCTVGFVFTAWIKFPAGESLKVLVRIPSYLESTLQSTAKGQGVSVKLCNFSVVV